MTMPESWERKCCPTPPTPRTECLADRSKYFSDVIQNSGYGWRRGYVAVVAYKQRCITSKSIETCEESRRKANRRWWGIEII